MKTKKILSTASLLAGAFICANLAGYGNSAYAATSSGKSYSQSMADFERGLEVRRGNAQGGARRSEIQKRRTDSDFVPASADYYGDSYAPRGDWSFSLGIEGFYAIATENLCKYKDYGYEDYGYEDYDEEEGYYEEGPKAPKIDLYGVNLRFTARKNSLFNSTNVVPEIYGILGVGHGNDTQTDAYADEYETGKDEYKYNVLTGQLALGANLRWIVNEHFSIFGGVRAGLSYTSVEFKDTWTWADTWVDEEGSETYRETDDGFGFLGGAGVGCDIAVNEHHAITLGVDYLVSTAKADLKLDEEFGIKTKTQQYCVFSVGYKYTF